MKPMNLATGLAGGLALLALAGCGGGGGAGVVPSMPDSPTVAAQAKPASPASSRVEPDPSPAEQVPVDEPAPPASVQAPPVEIPDPATVLESHEPLALPDGFAAVEVDTAMFLLANIPYQPARATGGGGGLRAASAGGLAPAVTPTVTERTAAYSPDHAVIEGPRGETVARVNPEVVTTVTDGMNGQDETGDSGLRHHYCSQPRGECVVQHPAAPGVSDGRGGRPVYTPIEDMPFISDVMREDAKGYRERGGVNLRYWSSRWGGNREVPWGGWEVDTATDTWSGYGAWNDWSGFGLVMLAHDHQSDLFDSAWYYAIAGGDSTGALPEVSGTWRGASVAMANDLSFIADGSATLTVMLGDNPTLDISMGDWQGYTLNGGEIGLPVGVSIGPLSATGIPITADGTFSATGYDLFRPGGTGEVSGAFYGPGGVEAAGVFSSNHRLGVASGVHGAFGAKRGAEPAVSPSAQSRPAAYSLDHVLTYSERYSRISRAANPGSEMGAGRCNVLYDCNIVSFFDAYEMRHSGLADLYPGRAITIPIEDMPFVSNTMREGAKIYRTRSGVDLHYWSSGDREVPWDNWAEQNAAETWSGYGAWNEWSGFGLVMFEHDHRLDQYDLTQYMTLAGGDKTPEMPEVSGTYRGAAVAMTNDLSYIADGDVEMIVRLGANPSLDIIIGNWQGYLLNGGEIGSAIDNVPLVSQQLFE